MAPKGARMSMIDMLANKVAEHSANGHVCGEVFQASYACHRDRGGSAVSEKLHPGFRILVRQHACHRPSQARMLGGERTIKSIVDPEAAVTVSFERTLPARDKLRNSIHRQSVSEGFKAQKAGFHSMFVFPGDAGKVQDPCRSKRGVQPDIRNVLADGEIVVRDRPGDMLIHGDQAAGGNQEKNVPLQVLAVEGSRVDLLLIPYTPFDEPHHAPVGRVLVGWLRVGWPLRSGRGWKPKLKNRNRA